MRPEYNDKIIGICIIIVIGVTLGLILEFSIGIPFYFIGILTLIIEVLYLIIIVCRFMSDYEKNRRNN